MDCSGMPRRQKTKGELELDNIFKLIKRVFPECKAGTLYEASKNCSEFTLRDLVRFVQREIAELAWKYFMDHAYEPDYDGSVVIEGRFMKEEFIKSVLGGIA